MYRTTDKDIWRVFREHHYLSADLNKAADCYTIYWGDVLVGFEAALAFPCGTIKHAYRNSRTVVLPDYQNLGIGMKMIEFLGDYYLSKGKKYFMRSTHLRLYNHWANTDKWSFTANDNKVSYGGNCSTTTKKFGGNDKELNRVAHSAEYLGSNYVNKPHIEIHIDNTPNINYDLLKQDLAWLKENYYICVITGEINTPSEIEDICLELGIRTQLLYTTKKGIATLNSKYKKKKILTTYDEAISKWVRTYFSNNKE